MVLFDAASIVLVITAACSVAEVVDTDVVLPSAVSGRKVLILCSGTMTVDVTGFLVVNGLPTVEINVLLTNHRGINGSRSGCLALTHGCLRCFNR